MMEREVYRAYLDINGEPFVFETGKVARQASGACVVRHGSTVVLGTVVLGNENPDIDYLPLMVDYRERYYSVGDIPPGIIKREGKPKDKEVLVSRLIDRPIRPLFPKHFKRDIQVVVEVFSADMKYPPDVLSISAVSCAISLSEIPFDGPIAGVRVGLIDGKFVINPSLEALENSELDIVLAGREEGIVMIEGQAYEVSEDTMLEAIQYGHEVIKKIIGVQKELVAKAGKEKLQVEEMKDEAIRKKIFTFKSPMKEAIFTVDKKERAEKMEAVYNSIIEELKKEYTEEEIAEKEKIIKHHFEELSEDALLDLIIDEGKRPDGRGFDDIRDIECEIGVLPVVHGSALFTRGQTQSLAVTTLGSLRDAQKLDDIEGEIFKRFILHYNFPPYSVGEVKRSLAPSRREIGHGDLAERSVEPVIPSEEEFPYTIRVVSEILESNGSSSMASVCSASLSLMDAGVPIKKPVAGIAIGLAKRDDKYRILTDIAGIEDHLGDMDLKVAGTRDGITGFQLDIKIKELSYDILKEALLKAKKARLKVLDIMDSVINKPREDISPNAPRVLIHKIPKTKIGDLIGPGGKVIKSIIDETGVEIDIAPDGIVRIYAKNRENAKRALEMIDNIVEDAKVGAIYDGVVTRIADFGAFVEIMPGKEGLVHISNISHKPVKNIRDFIKEGDKVKVKVLWITSDGKINLSIKDAK
jgi:polyribonucleotide nucleotidyltransferase